MGRISIEEFAALFEAVDPVEETGKILKGLADSRGKRHRQVTEADGRDGMQSVERERRAEVAFKRPTDKRYGERDTHSAGRDFRRDVLFPRLREVYAEKTGLHLL